MTTDNVVDIDEIIGSSACIILNKQKHYMKQMSVKEFLSAVQKAKDADKAVSSPSSDQASIDDILNTLVDSCLSSFPTVKRAELEALNFPQVNAIMTVIMEANAGEDQKESSKKRVTKRAAQAT